MKSIFVLFISLTICFINTIEGNAGLLGNLIEVETETENSIIYAFYDTRDRETFLQLTNTSSTDITVHVQIFNVDFECNENDFFDTYTPNDTHVYNMRDIQTNNENPSGVVLPDNAYGIVAIGVINTLGGYDTENRALIGNFRILDNAGYEYRTNMGSAQNNPRLPNVNHIVTLNFNSFSGITLSDFVIVGVDVFELDGEVLAADLDRVHNVFDVDILNKNEVTFSCRDVGFACIDQESLRQEELLERLSSSGLFSTSVVDFEYGINDAIPHSRGGEVLCPGNNISEGIIRLVSEFENSDQTVGYFGLNNGNGRGSMDSWWTQSFTFELGSGGNPN